MGIRASYVVSSKKSRVYFVSDFGNPNIQLTPSEQAPPASATVDIANDDISELAQQAKLNAERIKLFRWAVIGALVAFFTLLILLIIVVISYLCMIKSEKASLILSSNFWHIPLMIVFMATSILFATLKLSAHFGETKVQDEQQTNNQSLVSNIPVWQELIDAIKSLKK